MLSTKVEISLSTKRCPSAAKTAIKELSEVLSLLPINTYEESKSACKTYDCLYMQQQLWDHESIKNLEQQVMTELNRYGVVAISTENPKSRPIPDVLTFHPLGGHQYVFHLQKIRESLDKHHGHPSARSSKGEETVRQKLRSSLLWMFKAMESKHFLKIGVDLEGKLSTLYSGFLGQSFQGLPNTFDVQQLFYFNSHSSMYDSSVLKTMGDRRGLAPLSLLHNQYDHAIYDHLSFKVNKLGDWSRFDTMRKIFKKELPAMYRWRPEKNFLHPKQQLYLYLETATCLRAFSQSIWWYIQSGDIPLCKKADLFDCSDLFAEKVWRESYQVRKRNKRKIEEAKKHIEKGIKKREEAKMKEKRERQKKALMQEEEAAKDAEIEEAFANYKGPNIEFIGVNEENGVPSDSPARPPQPKEAEPTKETRPPAVQETWPPQSEVPSKSKEIADSVSTEQVSEKEVEDEKAEEAIYQGDWVYSVYYHPKTDQLGYREKGQALLVSENLEAIMCTCGSAYQTLQQLREHILNNCEEGPSGKQPKQKKIKIEKPPSVDLYSEGEQLAINKALQRREQVERQPHDLKTWLPNVSIYGLYIDPQKAMLSRADGDPGHSHFARNDAKKRQKLRARLAKELASRKVPEHLLENSLFMGAHCKDCGDQFHSPDTILCPVARYHNGLKVLNDHCSADFFMVFPCLY